MAKKRANGEGSIRKRSDGRWEGRYTAGYAKQTGGDLNKAARAWMEENIDALYASEYAAQQLLSEAMDTLQMLPKKEVCNNA